MAGLFNFDFYEILVWVAVALFAVIASAFGRVPLKKPGGIGQPLPNPLVIVLPIVFFTLMAALRKNIGDTFYYVHSFELMGDNNEVSFALFRESMFGFFQNIIRNMTDDPQWLIAFTGIMSVPVPIYILYKYSYPFEISIFLFVAVGYFGGLMNGCRQYMATAIVLLATKYLLSNEKNTFASYLKYSIIIVIASFMHSSALVMIPIYFVVRRPAWKLGSYLLIVASVVGVVFFDALMPGFLGALEQSDYSIYSENGWFTNGTEGGTNIFRVAVAIVPIVLAYINRDRMKMLGRTGDTLINIAFVNAAIYVLSIYNWIFARVAIYLSIYFIILTSWLLTVGVKPKDRTAYTIVGIMLFFIYSRWLSYQIAAYESDYFFPGRTLFGG